MDLKELLGKKKALDPDMKDTKMRVLKDMRKVASDAMSDGLKGAMTKATVVAKDKEGLEEGLDKAKELVASEETPELEATEEMLGEDLDGDQEMGESEEHKAMVLGEDESDMDELLEECDTPEKIDELMMKLAEKKKMLKV